MVSLDSVSMESILNYVLLMVGMSTIAGAGAKLMVPGNNPHGTLATFMIGFIATILSGLILKYMYLYLWNITEFNPVQFFTIVLSIVLGAIILFLYRILVDVFTANLTKDK